MSNEQHEMDKTPGIVSWNELATHDTAASTEFYTQLFGWSTKVDDMEGGIQYTSFQTADGRPVAGMIKMPEEAQGAPTMWMGYITVTDVAKSVAKAKELGATVHKDITTIPFGSFAIIGDPQGAVFGLWQFAQAMPEC